MDTNKVVVNGRMMATVWLCSRQIVEKRACHKLPICGAFSLAECPTAPTISPNTAVPRLGQTYTCQATGSPNATYLYTWTTAAGGIVSTQPTVTVSTLGPFTLMCNATLLVGGTPQCWNCSVINGTVIGNSCWFFATRCTFARCGESVLVLFIVVRTGRLQQTVYYVVMYSSLSISSLRPYSDLVVVFVVCPPVPTITPANPNPQVGDSYTCYVANFPTASYTWSDSAGHVLSTQSTITVNASGSFSFRCNASISVGSTGCYNVSVINGSAIRMYQIFCSFAFNQF